MTWTTVWLHGMTLPNGRGTQRSSAANPAGSAQRSARVVRRRLPVSMTADCMRRAGVVAMAVLTAATAGAQFVQYTAPGSLAVEQVPLKERLEAAMKEARYHLGPVRVGPWVALKDFGYLNNAYGSVVNPQSDITATVGVGAQAYVPVGPKVIVGLYALPEYVWWRDLTARRGWNGRGGAGVFGYFNRLTVELQGGYSREQQYVSSEITVPINLEDQKASALVELRVTGRLSLFGRGGVDRWRYNLRGLTGPLGPELTAIERNEQRAGGGVRLHLSDDFSVGVGAESLNNDFIHPEHDLSSSGTAPLLELTMKRAHVRASVSVARLDLKPKAGSSFVKYTGTMGQFQLGWRPHSRLELVWYGARNLVYSVYTPSPYFIDERTGLSAEMPFGWRSSARVFAEAGRDTYVEAPATGSVGTEDLKAWGGAFSYKLSELVAVVLSGSRTDYTTRFGPFDTSVTQVQATLQFSGGASAWW